MNAVARLPVVLALVVLTACAAGPAGRFAASTTSACAVVPAPRAGAPAARAAAHGAMHAIGAMATARAAHTATLLLDGRVFIAGGFGGHNQAYVASTELYDAAACAFQPAGTLHGARAAHTATRLQDGRVLIAGGFDGDYLASAELYDPGTGRFTPTGALNTARSDHVAVLLADGRVLVAGGVGAGWSFLASAELYDAASGSFRPTGRLTVARESHTMTLLHDGQVLVTGGHRGRRAAIDIFASAERYDAGTGTFTPIGDMLVARHKHDAVVLPNGDVLISGGADQRDDAGAYRSAERYDAMHGTFRAAAEMPAPRYKHRGTSVVLPSGLVLIAGGGQQAVLYDPAANQFRSVPGAVGTAPLSRLFATATLVPNGTVVLTGGYGRTQPTSAHAWVYQSDVP